MTRLTTWMAAAALAVLGQVAAAQDLALVIGNERYDRHANVQRAGNAMALARVLRQAGFDVTELENQSIGDLSSTASDLFSDGVQPDRLVVLLAGHFAHNGAGTFFLGRDAVVPNVFGLGRNGISVDAVVNAAAIASPRAVVMLVVAEEGTNVQPGVTPGLGPLDIPQGVQVVTGAPVFLRDYLRDGLLLPGFSYAAAAASAPEAVTVRGFTSSTIGFTAEPGSPAASDGSASDGDTPPVGEFAYWNAARDIGTPEALRAYLDRFPDGRFAAEARAEIARAQSSPEDLAAEAEAALQLGREARREVQRNLSLLGFDPRGIDGIFGNGTRAAIAAWQASESQPATGYLTAPQILALNTQAEIRARVLEEQAEQRRIEQEREDNAYWRRTGLSGGEADLRAYLDRYPDGVHADQARAQLDQIEARQRAEAQAEERAFWDDVRESDTATAYRNYLQRYPQGIFAGQAQARLNALTGNDSTRDQAEADRAEESRVAGNTVTRLLVEQRLAQLNFNTGRVDGVFDNATRRAIRRFQRARDITPTGFVTQRTLVLLLAAGLGR